MIVNTPNILIFRVFLVIIKLVKILTKGVSLCMQMKM